MVRASLVWALLLAVTAPAAWAQTPARSDGWVVIPVDEYRALRLRAYPPDRLPDPPPVEATISRVEYELRLGSTPAAAPAGSAEAVAAAGEARLTVDVAGEEGCLAGV